MHETPHVQGSAIKLLVSYLALPFFGSVLMVLSAKIAVPFYPVPLTLQTLVTVGLGFALGPVRGPVAVLLYLFEGLLGLPVFAGSPEKGVGIAYVIGPTGGFLLGFVLQAFVAGLFARRGWQERPVTAILAALAASALIYIPGLLWLGRTIGFDKPILSLGLFPFIAGDVFKAVLAALLFPAAWKLAGQRGRHE